MEPRNTFIKRIWHDHINPFDTEYPQIKFYALVFIFGVFTGCVVG